MTPLHFDHPALLALLPLALLPLLARAGEPLANSWAALMPSPDRASRLLQRGLLALAMAALALLVLVLAGPYWPEYTVEKTGRGAEIVLLLDRSRSMDQGFAGAPRRGGPEKVTPESLERYVHMQGNRDRDPKGQVARRLLADFVAGRPQDRFAMVAFSTLPLPVLPFTQKTEAVQAAIAAGNIGRGLSETNIGLALLSAIGQFADRPYTGSRIVMLVSDGGDRLDPPTREAIEAAVRKQRVALYWLYLRSANSPGLQAEEGAKADADDDTVPEHTLHRFFGSLGTPYRAYEADNDKDLQQAIEDVNRLENLPITYRDTVARRELAPYGCALALACVLLLLGAQMLELRQWS
ncbi:vWA domain-containing protein [Pelomonas sp. KK5]|uniref:vWA domain-containing protein n=1 Tax=Pelomonas sp. KK5 TaxID=1855730 RepID=UPI00097C9BF7|nr:vWA domain-containing protein [Pelomonas sp. KK5]